MTIRRTAPLLLCALIAGCGGSSKKEAESPGGGATGPDGAPAFLASIPDDTPYVFATLERTPKAYIEREYLGEAEETEELIEHLIRFREEHPEEFRSLGTFERLTFELLAEVKGKLSEEGLASLGIRLDAYAAFYGVGLLPAARIELLDAEKFSAAMERILERAGVQPETSELRGQSYWSFEIPELTGLRVVVAVVGDELVATLVTDALLDRVLPIVFGMEKPEQSLADTSRLQETLERHQFAEWGVGYVDLVGLARSAVADVSGLSREIANALDPEMRDEPACVEEIPALARTVPRIVLGSYGMEEEKISGAVIIELREDIAAELSKMTAWVPGLSSEHVDNAPMTFGLGLSAGRLLDYVEARLAQVASSPYKCSYLTELNDLAREAGQGLGMMRMTPISKVTGVNFILQDLVMAGSGMPQDIEGFAFVGTEDPAGLLQMAGQYLGAKAAQVKPGAAPVKLDVPGTAALLGDVFLAAGDRSVGVSVGTTTRSRLADLLAQGPIPDPPLFLSHIDPQFLAELEDEEIAAEYQDIAIQDPQLARALTEMDRGDFDQYNDLLITGHATDSGIELRFDATYLE